MKKRALSEEVQPEEKSGKKLRLQTDGPFRKVATPENAASVDRNPPFQQLLGALNNGLKEVKKGDCTVYWMRMEDLRSLSPLVSKLKFGLNFEHFFPS